MKFGPFVVDDYLLEINEDNKILGFDNDKHESVLDYEYVFKIQGEEKPLIFILKDGRWLPIKSLDYSVNFKPIDILSKESFEEERSFEIELSYTL